MGLSHSPPSADVSGASPRPCLDPDTDALDKLLCPGGLSLGVSPPGHSGTHASLPWDSRGLRSKAGGDCLGGSPPSSTHTQASCLTWMLFHSFVYLF